MDVPDGSVISADEFAVCEFVFREFSGVEDILVCRWHAIARGEAIQIFGDWRCKHGIDSSKS
jgi:hypothetical protein